MNTAAVEAATFLDPWVESRLGELYGTLSCDRWVADSCPRLGRLPVQLDQDVVAHAAQIAVRLSEGLSAASGLQAHRAAIADLILISWVERLTRHVVGEERLCPFLRCLSKVTSWDVEPEEATAPDTVSHSRLASPPHASPNNDPLHEYFCSANSNDFSNDCGTVQ